MASSIQIEIARLVLSKRWGALATLNDGAPLASMVAYAPEPELGGLLMFLSGLSAHTRNLLDDPRCSLAVTETDPGKGDPQTLPQRYYDRIARHVHLDSPETWQKRLEKVGFEVESCWDYFSPQALHALEWGHLFGLPSLLIHKLTGRWNLVRSEWNFALTRRLVARYTRKKLLIQRECAHSTWPERCNPQLMANPVRKYSYYLRSIFELLWGFEDPLSVAKIFLKLSLPGVRTIRLRGAGLVFRLRSAMDVWSLKETFIDRFYERFGAPVQDGWTIVDIGGGIGEFTLFAAHNHPTP